MGAADDVEVRRTGSAASRHALDAFTGELLALGRAEGLDAVGIASAEPLGSAREAIEARIAAGQHDGMAFTFKNPERSTDPGRSVRGAQAVVVGARAYARPLPERPSRVTGRVARYAQVDEYRPLRAALRAVARRLHADGWRAVVFADDNSLVDRAAAHRAGIGWYGKNANLLVPGAGSWFVLGAVVTDAPLPPSAGPAPDGCGPCRRCLDGCPTGAIVAPGVVDARRCLAWLAQKPGVFPRELRVALGDRIYGCDDCQEVCPPSTRQDRATPAAAHPAAHPAGPVEPQQAWPDLAWLVTAPDHEILARHGHWYVADRDLRWVRRNAVVALGNLGPDTGQRSVAAALLAAVLAGADPVLRAHAVWAAARLGRTDLLDAVRADPAPEVQAELAALPPAAPSAAAP